MPFTSEQARKAGMKSKRGPNVLNPLLLDLMLNKGSVKAVSIMGQLDGKDYIDAFTKLAPYVWPKLQQSRVEHSGETVNKLEVAPEQIKDLIDGLESHFR